MRTLLQTICLGAVIAAPSLFAQFSSPVRETDRPEKRAFNYEYTCATATNCNPLGQGITIPAGSRMVIEYVSGAWVSQTLPPILRLRLSCTLSSNSLNQLIPSAGSASESSNLSITTFGQATKIYCDTVPDLAAIGVASGTPGSATLFSISGYFATK